MNKTKFDIIIVGGGPAGSLAALQLAKFDFDVCLIEQKNFPRETLCGEFISKEVTGALGKLNLLEKFKTLNPNEIDTFQFVNHNGKSISNPLPFKGYGLKRSTLDSFLLNEAKSAGAMILQPAKVMSIEYDRNNYLVQVSQSNPKSVYTLEASIVIGAYGKRSVIDSSLNRDFTKTSSNLNGIKFHLDINHFKKFDKNKIMIYAKSGLYCGLNLVNDNKVTVCYLIDSNKNPDSPQKELIQFIESISSFGELFNTDFQDAILDTKIFGAGNIHFGEKEIVKNGVYMIGDSARVIAPLAGDGIAMAVESALLISSLLIDNKKNNLSNESMQKLYINEWQKLFARRLRNAKVIQNMIFTDFTRNIGSKILSLHPGLLSNMVKMTRNL